MDIIQSSRTFRIGSKKETRISYSGSAVTPAIYGNLIVWSDGRNGNGGDIYMYDLSAKKEMFITNSGSALNPDIYGNKIVWEEGDPLNEGKGGISLYDLSSKNITKIAENHYYTYEGDPPLSDSQINTNPAIYSNRIAWIEINYADVEPFTCVGICDLSTNMRTEIGGGASGVSYLDVSSPDIYNNKIVWSERPQYDSSSQYVCSMYDFSTKNVTKLPMSGYGPRIYGDRIVWGNSIYDLSTKNETQITTSGSASNPRIYEDRIVWQDNRNGGSDIYMATLISSNPLVADFSASPASGSAPLEVNFTDNSTGNPTSWNWSFGDGQTSIEKNPVHTYYAAGTYTVNLTVSNADSTDSKSATITVLENPVSGLPVANFSNNISQGYVPLSVQFTDLSENTATINWDFGDGVNSTEKNPVHTYTIAGIYTVILTASNVNGTDSKSATITVLEKTSPVLPVANFSTSVSEGYAPLSVQFTDLSENATGRNWDFGDGTFSTEQNPIHTYSAAGNYTVNLTASNENGTASTSSIIIVKNQPTALPVADFKSDVTAGCTPLTVQFTDLSKYAAGWNWDFGDGTTSTEQNPMHTYNSIGNYTVTLTVNNEAGRDTEQKVNYIIAKPVSSNLIAAFYAVPTSGNVPLKVEFIDRSTGKPISWKWSFGDGKYSTAQNPVHTYSKAGKYTVSLIVKNSKGSVKLTKYSYINVINKMKAPVAAFSAFPTSGNAPLKVAFTDRSKGGPTSWKWSFGDGTYSTAKNPVHTYKKAGKYTVSLTVKNAAGKSTVSGFNYIKAAPPLKAPVAAFSASPTSGKAPLTVKFKDKSTGSPTSWYWNFGDGKTSKLQNPTHTYKVGGAKKYYTVTLTVKNAAGYNTKKIFNYIRVSK